MRIAIIIVGTLALLSMVGMLMMTLLTNYGLRRLKNYPVFGVNNAIDVIQTILSDLEIDDVKVRRLYKNKESYYDVLKKTIFLKSEDYDCLNMDNIAMVTYLCGQVEKHHSNKKEMEKEYRLLNQLDLCAGVGIILFFIGFFIPILQPIMIIGMAMFTIYAVFTFKTLKNNFPSKEMLLVKEFASMSDDMYKELQKSMKFIIARNGAI